MLALALYLAGVVYAWALPVLMIAHGFRVPGRRFVRTPGRAFLAAWVWPVFAAFYLVIALFAVTRVMHRRLGAQRSLEARVRAAERRNGR